MYWISFLRFRLTQKALKLPLLLFFSSFSCSSLLVDGLTRIIYVIYVISVGCYYRLKCRYCSPSLEILANYCVLVLKFRV